jgi:hypothetical protein
MKKETSATFSPSKSIENSPSKKIKRGLQINKLPYSIILYILQYYNYKQPVNFSLYSLFGYFKEDTRRTLYLLFSSIELFHYPKNLFLPKNLIRLSTNSTALKNMISSKQNEIILFKSLSEIVIENPEEEIFDELFKFTSIVSLKVRDRSSQNTFLEKKILKIMKNNKLKNFDFESQVNFDFEQIAKELSSHPLLSLRLGLTFFFFKSCFRHLSIR